MAPRRGRQRESGRYGIELALDQERGTRARVGFLTNQPRTIGISTRVNF
jgi:hypothetical protein